MDKLRYILDDMVQWNEIKQEDADLIYATVRNDFLEKERVIAKLIKEVSAAEDELVRFKLANPQTVIEANRKANNDAIIMQFRLRKGKKDDSN
jgi:hypothetical protein